MNSSIKKFTEKLVYFFCMILSILFVYYGFIEFLSALQSGEEDLRSIDMPKWLLMLPFPVGFSLIAIEFGRYFFGFDTYYSDRVGSGETI